MKKKECVAMILAGGQGSRLSTLTRKMAKPAVPFGGKYRIVDFTLSNCAESGIDTVGVLTQYQPLALNEYIGSGQPWDLDRMNGGVTLLPPHQKNSRSDWYKGTANAVYQNFDFIDRFRPDYVLVLSGDHVYKMDYGKLLEYHKTKNAGCTIAVIDVPPEEASRFGIMTVEESGRITDFTEKPEKPKSTSASMGIYVFNTALLKSYLAADERDPGSANDFGKNIIPAMLGQGEALYAYPFSGYWKDVGTLQSLWQANMDLLGDNPVCNLYDQNRRIYSRTQALAPHYLGENASVTNSIVTEGCEIYGTVENSVLFQGVVVKEGAVVRDSVLMQNVSVGKNASVEYALIDRETRVESSTRVGREKELESELTVVGGGLKLKQYEN